MSTLEKKRIVIPLSLVLLLWLLAACDNASDELTPLPPPVVNIIQPGASMTITQGASLIFEAASSGGVPPVEYFWDYGDPAIEPNFWFGPYSKTFDNLGTFTVTFTARDDTGQEGSETLQITVEPAPAPAGNR